MTILVQDLTDPFPQIYETDSLSEALDVVSRFDRCQIIDLETGIIRVYNRSHVLVYEDTVSLMENLYE